MVRSSRQGIKSKKKNIKQKKTDIRRKKHSIKTKLVAIMMLLIIIPITIIGTISYQSSSRMMTDQYRELGMTIGDQITNSIELRMKAVERSLDTLATTDIMLNLENPERQRIIMDKFSDIMIAHSASAVYFVDGQGNTLVKGFEGGDLSTSAPWYAGAIDGSKKEEVLWGSVGEYENNSFYITVSRAVYDENSLIGVLGMDIPVDIFDSILTDIRIGETGFPILIDGNAIKVALKDTEEIGTPFKGKERFANMAGNSTAIRNEYIKNGVVQDQFMIANKVNNSDWHVVTIVPINNIKTRTREMLKIIAFVGVVTLVAGTAISILFSSGIITPINKMLASIRKMEEGDFTEKINIKNKDELGEFRDSFNNMTDKVSILISHIKDVCKEVNRSSEELASISAQTSKAGEGISRTACEIARGASDQAEEVATSASLMLDLSSKLEVLNRDSIDVLNLVADATANLDNNDDVMSEINRNTEKNLASRYKVAERITELDRKIGQVGGILSTIDEIAEQTNLLALNASIEAARAGEYGKGFAVVAEEIRKLAGQSKDSSSNIKTIIEDVQAESRETVEVMGNVELTNEEQSKTSEKINATFDNLSGIILKITSKIEEIGVHINDINKDKDGVVASIETISSVSEETAASSEEVSASITEQSYATLEVSKATNKLKDLSKKLNEEISKFKS